LCIFFVIDRGKQIDPEAIPRMREYKRVVKKAMIIASDTRLHIVDSSFDSIPSITCTITSVPDAIFDFRICAWNRFRTTVARTKKTGVLAHACLMLYVNNFKCTKSLNQKSSELNLF